MGGGGGDSKSTTQPWSEQIPHLAGIFNTAGELAQTQPKYFKSSTVAGFDPYQLQAQEQAYARAMAGSPIQSRGKEGYFNTISGAYLTPESNPWLRETYGEALETAAPPIDSSATQSGRFGSGAWGNMRGRTASGLATGIYGGNYQTERDRQWQGLQYAPEYAQTDYNDIRNLSAVGAEKQQMSQNQLSDLVRRWEFDQNKRWNTLFNYRNAVTGGFGGTVNAQQPGK